MAEYKCSNCGEIIENDSSFCRFCGHEIHKSRIQEQKTQIYSGERIDEQKTIIYENQNKKSKNMAIILVLFAFLIIISLFLIRIPYSVEESYTEMEPYEIQEKYIENVPLVEEICSTRDFKYSAYQDTLHTASGGYFKTTGSISNEENEGGSFNVQIFYFNSFYHPYTNRAFISNSDADLKSEVKVIFVAPNATEHYTIIKYSNATGQWWTRTQVYPPSIKDCMQTTKYKEEERNRNVTKYREVTKERTITRYKTIFEILTNIMNKL